jgi:uncharacterized protein (TIGR02246 family)
MLRMVMAVACVFCVAGQAAAQSDPVSIQKAVREAGAKWAEAYTKSDAKALAALYAEDAYLLPPGAEMIHGRSAIEAFWQQHLDVSDWRYNTIEIKPVGDKAAREIGTVSFKTKDQQPHETKYAVVWENNDGRWQLSQDIWNATK